MTADEPAVCPYPGHDTVVCPECYRDIRGVVPGGTSGDPEPRCPVCDEVLSSVVVRD